MWIAGIEIRKPVVPDAIVTVDATENGKTLSALLTTASSSLSNKAIKVWIQNIGTGNIQWRFHSTTLVLDSAAILEPGAWFAFSADSSNLTNLRLYAASGAEKLYVLQEGIG